MSKWWLFSVAVIIGVLVIAGENILFSLLTGKPTSFSSDVEPVNALLVAIPFIILALIGTTKLLPWLVGLALTLLLWGYALYSGVSYQRHPDGSGADIGLGLIIMASPVFISAIVLAVYAALRRISGRTRRTAVHT
ncbi:MAG: hypothetical protein QOH81_2710 [Sphingomonadales bacterium]|jgi:hypothetical protein|nr:hypothetical protein [Sphingomonadales bacterium]